VGELWQLDAGTTQYSVRQSGASVRLYSNRVFHSQWNPTKPFASGIWDCLSLPVLYRDPESVKKILLLGVGGGTVIRQLQHLVDFDELTAIDIDVQHLKIAKRWFGVNDPRVQLVHDDAIAWVQQYDGPAFDIIIDDLFGHDAGEPLRAIELNAFWLEPLLRHLSHSGLLIANCVSSRELNHALPRQWSRHLEICGLDKSSQRQARTTNRRPLRGFEMV